MSVRDVAPLGATVATPARTRRRWPGYALAACGVALLPWLYVLATNLPPTASAPHWATAWVGLDAMEAAGLIATGLLMVRRHPLRAAAAGATGTLLVVDAWFDVMTSTGSAFTTALVMACTAELPLAAVCVTVAIRVSSAAARAEPAVRRPTRLPSNSGRGEIPQDLPRRRAG
ncbi:hypothetical protein OG552_11290 [Streptomyces sp. NBC_01476]|uniref:hypothetical protein n=1 Tax=Streptomyces sp. NBC_01476 TaxID=2903881 RepID=UPI002E314809|nr:hypothetical protein [Streptomyces sp. NBC_01476]